VNPRPGRILWPTLAFLAGFAVLLILVSHWYLIPALRASQTADPIQKRHLVAQSRLVLAILLFILIAGILLTFRFGRLLVPRVGEKHKPTQYSDAWAESAKRVSVPPRDADEDDEPA
jgi:hypothetical protein